MGYYINSTPKRTLGAIGKARDILEDVEGSKVVHPTKWEPNLVCVVSNGWFDAAGYAFDDKEFAEFAHPDGRSRVWLSVPGAAELSCYTNPEDETLANAGADE